MKFIGFIALWIILILFQGSNGYDLIHESCAKASKNDPIIRYDFCVASLDESVSSGSSNPPTSVEDLVAISIQITKSNATNIVSIISNLLKEDPTNNGKLMMSEYAKECLRDCSDLYSDSVFDLDDATTAFESQDFDTASIKVSAAMEASVTCENQFSDGNEESPLTENDNTYFELNAMSLAFIKMHQ